MKYIITLVVLFVIATPAYAAQILTGHDPITGAPIYKFVDDGANAMAMTQSWGLTGYQTPVVVAGAVTVDEAGNSTTCPWFYPQGCFNLSKTDYYRKQMIDTAKQHKALGWYFPSLAYWYSQI